MTNRDFSQSPPGLMLEIRTAWLFLTRLPWPGGTAEAGSLPPLSQCVRAFPLVGLGVGALAGFALWGAAKLGLHPLAAAFLGLTAAALATGALHEDGLADVADGFGGGADKARKLEIMRDSRIGTYGVLALVFSVGLKATLLGGFNGPGLAAAALIAAHVASRSALPLLMGALPAAREDGLGHGAGSAEREGIAFAAILGTAICLLVAGFGQGLAAVALAGLGAAFMGWLAKRQIGGQTGDVLGAAQQVAEFCVLFGLAIAGRWA